MGSYQGLIFDFNGVLWWDSALQERSWNLTAVKLRGAAFTEDEFTGHMHGRTNRHVLEYLAGRSLSDPDYQRLMNDKESMYRQLCLDEGALFALSSGAVELLDFLKTHQIPQTIATASEKTNLAFFFKYLGLARWFELDQVVYDDGSRPGKPDPDVYLAAADRLRISPARCVVVEDSLSGIRAAHAAAIGYMIALGPKHKHPELASLDGVSLVVEKLADVPRAQLFLNSDFD